MEVQSGRAGGVLVLVLSRSSRLLCVTRVESRREGREPGKDWDRWTVETGVERTYGVCANTDGGWVA